MKKNTAVCLWSFIFVVAISLRYLNLYVWNDLGEKFFNGGIVISFFMFLFGYFIVWYYKNNDIKRRISASSKAWNFLCYLLKRLYPLFLFGVIISFGVRNLINGMSITSILPSLMDSIWEFLGLSQLGSVGLVSYSGISFDNVVGFSHLWNEPLWIFSAFFIVGFILYYIYSKNEDLFKGLIAPFIILSTYGMLGLGKFTNNDLCFLGISFGLLRVFSCVSIGMLSYYVVDYFKNKKDFSETLKLTFSVIHIACIVFFLYTIFAGITWAEVTNELFCLLFMIVLLVNRDYIGVMYNNSKACEFLGTLSIYYYVLFIVWVFTLKFIFPNLSYTFSILFNILFSFGSAYIVYMIQKIWKKE